MKQPETEELKTSGISDDATIPKKILSRRDFLKYMGATAALATTANVNAMAPLVLGAVYITGAAMAAIGIAGANISANQKYKFNIQGDGNRRIKLSTSNWVSNFLTVNQIKTLSGLNIPPFTTLPVHHIPNPIHGKPYIVPDKTNEGQPININTGYDTGGQERVKTRNTPPLHITDQIPQIMLNQNSGERELRKLESQHGAKIQHIPDGEYEYIMKNRRDQLMLRALGVIEYEHGMCEVVGPEAIQRGIGAGMIFYYKISKELQVQGKTLISTENRGGKVSPSAQKMWNKFVEIGLARYDDRDSRWKMK